MIIYDPTITCTHIDAIDLGFTLHHMVQIPGTSASFTTTSPGYHVNPKRVNGSAVETIFSQLKHTTSSNLTAANYESAKATLLTRAQSKGKDAYRSATLYLWQTRQEFQNHHNCTCTQYF